MDPTTAFFAFIIENGLAGFLLIALIYLANHHLKILNQHKKTISQIKKDYQTQLDHLNEEKNKLEKELREKIEELLKDQLEAQKPLTEALIEYNRLVRNLKRFTNEKSQ